MINQTSGNGYTNNRPSGPRCTTNEFYAYFNDPNDIRNNQWLTGLQYWPDGSPIIIRTTNSNYDQFYSGGAGSTNITYHLNLTPLGSSTRLGANSYDLGRDGEIAWNSGYRNVKFLPDPNSTTRNQNNDVPVFPLFRYPLNKSGSYFAWRNSHTRPYRSFTDQCTACCKNNQRSAGAVTLSDIYAERCRELSWECWMRNDMIRFGRFEDAWGLSKTNSETYRRIFPIPTSAIAVNPKLTQNPGYN